MKTSSFDFPLPEEFIALRPKEQRDASRLLVLHRDTGEIQHRLFADLPQLLEQGDMLVLNRTKVLPVLLTGMKPTGGRLSILLVKNLGGTAWEIMSKGSYTGRLFISPQITATITGGTRAELEYSGQLRDVLMKSGQMPLPPYIKRQPDSEDLERYQTVFARDEGSIAAPTAGLHFTDDVLSRLKARGVRTRYITLHVGKGTFTPIKADRVEEHGMEAERFSVSTSLIKEMSTTKGRLVAVGTTVTRTLEAIAHGRFSPVENPTEDITEGSTNIFIYPGHQFRAVGGLLTNFHLPRSTPLMLAAAFAGREKLLDAYHEAVLENYRFFSYGDAMLIL